VVFRVNDAIVVEGLEKSYGRRRAVAGISFSVRTAEIVGLLGPNGAGKTTTIEILEGLRGRDAGEVSVLGRDPKKRDRRLNVAIGVVPQSSGIDGELTVRETMRLYSSFYRGRRSVDDVIEVVGLRAFETTRLSSLSGGLRRRVDLALAIIGNPSVLFLDEPTTGLDPAARRKTWEVIAGLRAAGTAILLTSHYLEEVQFLANRVIVMRAGTIVANDEPDRIGGSPDLSVFIDSRCDDGAALPVGPWERVPASPGVVELVTDDATESVRILSTWAVSRGVKLEGLEVRHRSLEERYLELTAEP
jgi:ABC-2 type transport system ATP-binding protein